MIWFACKSCGKKHSRSDAEGGSLIFCACGASLRVPFDSTALPDAPAARPFPASSPMPAAIPIPPARPVPVPDALPVASVPLPADDGPPPTYRPTKKRFRKVDANSCWHHDDDRSDGKCVACHLPFCAGCLVELRGQRLCGPCKNFRVAGAGQPTRTLPLAVMALVGSLVAAPVGVILSLVGAGLFQGDGTAGAAVLLAGLGLIPAGAALGLCIWVLMRLEGQTRLGGRAMACGGACVSLAGVLWCVSVLTFVFLRHGGG